MRRLERSGPGMGRRRRHPVIPAGRFYLNQQGLAQPRRPSLTSQDGPRSLQGSSISSSDRPVYEFVYVVV